MPHAVDGGRNEEAMSAETASRTDGEATTPPGHAAGAGDDAAPADVAALDGGTPLETVPEQITETVPPVDRSAGSPRPPSAGKLEPGEQDGASDSRLDDDSEVRIFPNVRAADGATVSSQWTRKSKSRRTSGSVDVAKHKMHKFSLYETQSRYYLVGGDLSDETFRVLKIDRTAPPGQLGLVEDDVIYDKYQMNSLLVTIDQGNKKTGGMKLRGNSWGLLGFIRFTESYYMLMITKKSQVAMVGGHYIYQVDDTQLVPLTTGPSSKSQANKNSQEQRYLSILNNLDLHRSFYFSYSYNVTQSLQNNVIRTRRHPDIMNNNNQHRHLNDMFVWNHHLLDPAREVLKNPHDWCLPIIHGSVDQSSIDVFGRSIWITLIARRSRFFAGARFLKRGANDLGYVANDVETEQIVANQDTTALDAPGRRLMKNPNYTSFLQHRGSIPLYWTQDNTGVTPKPAIELNFIDPFYTTAALHFDNLFERYGAPITVINLVKARERTPRESKLLVEFENAIAYLNQTLPEDKAIIYRQFDMARAAKTRGQDVIGSLETVAQDLVQRTGFFHNGTSESEEACVQNGVTRSNCIDCLDRTNACQFVVGKTALALQLQALGIIAGDLINYNSDASNILAHMYNDHGDTLASQYGGSHLVNTTDSYQKINNWQSHSRDMLESFKRYYHNSFLDSQRQEAYNLFLGNYRHATGQPMLWDLPTDYWLHHASPSSYYEAKRRSYIKWYTPEFLKARTMPPSNDKIQQEQPEDSLYDSEWWHEYYKPDTLTSFSRSFAYRVNSSTRYLPKHYTNAAGQTDRSPFAVRSTAQDTTDTASISSKQSASPAINGLHNAINPLSASSPPMPNAKRIVSLTRWLEDPSAHSHTHHHNTASAERSLQTIKQEPVHTTVKSADKSQINQWAPEQFYENSLNPTVPKDQSGLYEDYTVREVPPLPALDPGSSEGALPIFQAYQKYASKTDRIADENPDEGTLVSVDEYKRYLDPSDEPLSVKDGEWGVKRYKVYDRWLKGRNIIRQGGGGKEKSAAVRE